MYDRIVGKEIKVVFRDGDRITVLSGLLQAYDESLKTLLIDTARGEVFINATQIDKIEVLTNG